MEKSAFLKKIVYIVKICSSLKCKKRVSGLSLHGSFAFVVPPLFMNSLKSFVSSLIFVLFYFQLNLPSLSFPEVSLVFLLFFPSE